LRLTSHDLRLALAHCLLKAAAPRPGPGAASQPRPVLEQTKSIVLLRTTAARCGDLAGEKAPQLVVVDAAGGLPLDRAVGRPPRDTCRSRSRTSGSPA